MVHRSSLLIDVLLETQESLHKQFGSVVLYKTIHQTPSLFTILLCGICVSYRGPGKR